jgi:hypothetical protein
MQKEGHSSNTLLLMVILVISVITLLLVLMQSYAPRSMSAEAAEVPEYALINSCVASCLLSQTEAGQGIECTVLENCMNTCNPQINHDFCSTGVGSGPGSCVNDPWNPTAVLCSQFTTMKSCTDANGCLWQK